MTLGQNYTREFLCSMPSKIEIIPSMPKLQEWNNKFCNIYTNRESSPGSSFETLILAHVPKTDCTESIVSSQEPIRPVHHSYFSHKNIFIVPYVLFPPKVARSNTLS